MDLVACFFSAGEYYGVNPHILMAIAKVESGFNPRAVNRNRNGSLDRGIMQINTLWDKHLKRHGINPSLVWHPCYNIYLGAMVLKHCQNIFGNEWRAVDCYNKGLKAKPNSPYVWKVYKNYRHFLSLYPERRLTYTWR